MTLLRLPLVIGAAASYHISGTAPAQSARDEQIKSSSNESFLHVALKAFSLMKIIYWTGAVLEVICTLSFRFPDQDVPLLIRSLRGPYPPQPPSVLFVIAGISSILGGLLRLTCYRTLGQSFTFQLSIRKSQSLVTTGPYAYVRHPSYTGFFICYVGILAMHFSPDSWMRDSGVLTFRVVRWAVGVLVGFCVVLFASVFGRMGDEDKVLKRVFGKEWERWAERVRYRLIPGVY
ncbi:hypothetical protein BS17DRAFT_109429 [Gyrodon lividus]|nr:hypothetical protein BS17DRAFT_109429 [Gyrodon lividus]